MPNQSKERRGFVRVPFNTETEIKAGGRLLRSSDGIDVSMGGLHMQTNDPIPAEGSACNIRIMLAAADNQVAIEAQGEVIRSEPGSLAVRFTELDLDSYHHLKQLILNNTDDPERAEQEFSAHWGIRPPAPPE